MLKICFAGLGSIGQRHLKNIVKLLQKEKKEFYIDAIRSGDRELQDEIKQYIRQEYRNFAELPSDYDIFFVTNPTVNHLETIRKAALHTEHMFIEKPVFDRYYSRLDTLKMKDGNIYYVACPLRYIVCLNYIKKKISTERIYSVRCISSSFLPDWRKGTDYRKIYSADAARGGGVTLDLIHELDYITDLFGMPEHSLHVKGKYSDLEITSDDLSLYILQYADKLVEIHLDYFGRETVRRLELYCRNYVIKCDLIANEIKYVYPDHTEKIKFETQDIYEEEMKAFLGMLERKTKNSNTIQHANQVLKLAVQ